MTQRTVVRANGIFMLYWICVAVCAIALASVVVTAQSQELLAQVAPLPILIIALGWVFFGWPCVVYTAVGVEVRNPFQTVRVPLGEVIGDCTRRGFSLETTDGTVQAWGAPPPDRISIWRGGDRFGKQALKDPRFFREGEDSIRASRLPGFASGDAAALLAHYQRQVQVPPRGKVIRDTNWLNIAVSATGVIIALLLAIS